MAGFTIDDKEFQAWAKRVNEKIATDKVKHGMEVTMRRVKAQSMRMVKAKTPVGKYPKSSSRVGGHLRRTWHVDGPFITGTVIALKLYNNTEYAPFVENGHRTRGGGGWVEGRFMLKNTVTEIDGEMPQLIAPSFEQAIRGLLD
ncbi:HK97 gp10 family phage protein [Levilactobacillus namurensis]|uniref:HK97 gp10 family phage protein n=1 Tax=Levilactobacillus namurensis TaxID=380393 RepID=UPI0026F2B743|nr:HK97 gp10 family phage protein [Levilactobacillus namurensis]